ncbi:DNRLRE domain-containing protein [Demequina aurantiaca]|uniref:DNRLRE domain-containing protein n=1 Tax=Demequina aurantiaca TaxID=676200 RepID=UPI003D352E7D
MAIPQSVLLNPFFRVPGVVTAAVVVAALVITTSAEAAVEPPADLVEVVEDSVETLTSPDSISAQMRAKLSGVEVEDLSQRSETTSAFALPDGSWRADIAAGPVWVETGEDPTTEEGWESFDATLTEFTDGSFRAAAHPNDVVLSGGGSGKVLLAAATDSLTGHTLEMWWKGKVPEPILEDNFARYVDIKKGVDLVIEVNATGFEQYFVVNERPKSGKLPKLPLRFEMDGAEVSGSNAKGFTFADESGDVVARVSDAAAWDAVEDLSRLDPVTLAALPTEDGPSASPTPDADGAVVEQDLNAAPDGEPVSLGGSTDGDAVDLSMTVPVAVVTDPEVEYPLVIDPSVTLSPSFDTSVTNAATFDKSGESELFVGTFNGGTAKYRSYLNFGISAIKGASVTAAAFKIYNHHSWSCTAKGWEVWSTATTSSSTRWTNMPSFSTKYASPTTTKGYSSSCADGYASVDIKSMAQAWANGTASTVGVGLKASSETDNFYWKRFYSGNSSSNKPVLSISYNRYPSTPSSVKVNAVTPVSGAVYYTNDTTPTFSATVSDADGGSVKGRFTVTKGTSTIVTKASGSAVASGSTSSYTPSALAQGDYKVEVWANDSALDSKASSKPSWTVTVDTAAPGATAITSSQFSNGQWKDTAPSSVSAALSATDAVKFEYKVDGGTVKTVTATSGSATVTALPRTNGGHKLEARAIDRANNSGAWVTFKYGIGAVGITAPAAGFTTTDKAVVKASAPPGVSGDVERVVYWRPSGQANGTGYGETTGSASGWTEVAELSKVADGGATDVNYTWSAASSVPDAYERLPYRMDVQVCFTYVYTADTRCSWTDDVDSHTSVVRLPHAFGDAFPVADAGPGQVALWTGEFNTTATDVSVPGYTGTLSVSRSYNSFAGGTETSPFGSGWAPSFEGSDVGAAGLTVIDTTGVNGMIALEDVDGTYLLYGQPGGTATAQKTGTYVPLDTDTESSGWSLTLSGSGTSSLLTVVDDAGVSTVWAHRGSGLWQQERVTEPGGESTTFTYTLGKVTRILGPVPDGVTCTTLVAGCRALNISYYSATSAASNAYVGRVSEIESTAWDPALEQMTEVVVAKYSYDSSGRLTKVTDPRSGRSTSYGYGAVTGSGAPTLTSVTPAGLAPWKIDYGTSASVSLVSRLNTDGSDTYVPTTRLVYGIDPAAPPSGSPEVRPAAAAWGQSRVPSHGFAVFSQGEDPGGSSVDSVDAAEWRDAELMYTDGLGYTINSAQHGAGSWQFTATEYDDGGRVVRALDESATAHLMEQSSLNDGEPVAQDEVNAVGTVTRYNDEIVSPTDLTWDGGTIPQGTVLLPAGSVIADVWAPSMEDENGVPARLHTHYEYDEGAPNSAVNPVSGQRFALMTSITQTRAEAHSGTWDTGVVVDSGEPLLAEFLTGYDPIDGASATEETSGWRIGAPTTMTTTMDDGAQDIVTRVRYDALGRVVERREPGSSGTDAKTELAVYYSATPNSDDSRCGKKPEWAGELCVSGSGEATRTVPSTYISSYTRDLEAETVIESVGSAVRETSMTFLVDGNVESVSTSVSGVDGSVPIEDVWLRYDSSTGLHTGTASGSANGPKVETFLDSWSRPISYVDTDGATSTTSYDSRGQVASVDDGLYVTSYTYDGADARGAAEHRGLATGMRVQSSDGTAAYDYKAAYDAAGKLELQTLPGDLTQTRAYSLAGHLLGLSYSATDTNGDTLPLVAWSQQTDLFGRVVAEATPSAGAEPSEAATYDRGYEYDRAGRLTGVTDRTAVVSSVGDNESPSSDSACISRAYTFDVRGNRLSRSSSVSDAEGACVDPSTGTTEAWSYDTADRVQTGANNAGQYEYDAFGRQTVIPATDTPLGPEQGDIEVAYFDNDLARSIGQSDVSTEFELDPMKRRTSATTTSETGTSSEVSHYSDLSDSPAWALSTNAAGAVSTSWYGSSIVGDLGLTVTDGTAALHLSNMHGDVAVSVTLDADGDTASIGAFSEFDEYGRTQTTSLDAETGVISYGWLGASERASDGSGIILMGVRLYNPMTGLFTSIDPIKGGNSTPYAYPQDPVNNYDLSGTAVIAIPLLGGAAVLALVVRALVIVAAVVAVVWLARKIYEAAKRIPWPQLGSRTYRAIHDYRVYQIHRVSNGAIWKYGITSVEGNSRPASQISACYRYFKSACTYLFISGYIKGFYNARLWEASYITAYWIKYKKCPPGQSVSCR